MVIGTHLQRRHQISGEEYVEEYGPDSELSSEAFRAEKFRARPIKGIAHWEGLWSRYYVIDWIIKLHEDGHPLNYMNFTQNEGILAITAWKIFGSWDSALLAAGLNPADERLHPVGQEWTPAKAIEKLQEFALARRKKPRLRMTDDLRCALTRNFPSLKAASKAAGVKHEEISSRALFQSPKVAGVVNALRKLENLKGRERHKKLREICGDHDNLRIIRNYYKSLQDLAKLEGLDPHVVSNRIYRDEADVHHDLDIIEQREKFSAIRLSIAMTCLFISLSVGPAGRGNGWACRPDLHNPEPDPPVQPWE